MPLLLLLSSLVLVSHGYYIVDGPVTFFAKGLLVESSTSSFGRITVGLLDDDKRDFGKISLSSNGLKVNINHNCPSDDSEFAYEFEDHYREGKLKKGDKFSFSYDNEASTIYVSLSGEEFYEVVFNQDCLKRRRLLAGFRLGEGEENSAVSYLEAIGVVDETFSILSRGFKSYQGISDKHALQSCPVGSYSSSGECLACPEGTLSKKESPDQSACVEGLLFPDLASEVVRHRKKKLIRNIFDSIWPFAEGTKLSLRVRNDQNYRNDTHGCNFYIHFEDIETELTIAQEGEELYLEADIGTVDSTTTSLNPGSASIVINVVFGEGEFIVMEGEEQIVKHSYTPSNSGNPTVVFIEEDPNCMSFIEAESSVGFASDDEMEEFSVEVELPIEVALPAKLCKKPRFVDCVEILLHLNETWADFDIKSLVINEIPEKRSVVVKSDKEHTYTVNTALFDAKIGDGHAQDKFFLEADNGTAIIEITYTIRSDEELVTIDDEIDDELTTDEPRYVPAPPEEIATEQVNETVIIPPTYKPEEEIVDNEEMKELVINNVLKFTVKTSVDVDPDDVEVDPDEKMEILKIDFGNSTIPTNYLKKKMEEYEENRNETNILGFLVGNGFTDSGMMKTYIKKEEAAGKGSDEILASSIPSDDLSLGQDSMIESIKAFQRFNGFPETGEINEEQLNRTKAPRCGNPDMNFKDEQDQFTCVENPGMMETGADKKREKCILDHDSYLDICAAYPTQFLTDKSSQEQKDFVKAKAYFLELDINFKAQKKGKKVSHIGIAFNFNETAKKSDFLIVQHESHHGRLCFSFGTYNHGKRDERRKVRECKKFTNKEQKVLGRFKAILTVYETPIARRVRGDHYDAQLSINGERVFFMNTTVDIRSSAYVFTLGGRNYRSHHVQVFTSRICRRRIAWTNKHRSKRFLLSNFKWHPNGEPITYAFANYSSTLGEKLTRQEVLRAINIYANTGIYFEEYASWKLHIADVTFMFISGRHSDGKAFYGSGAEKAHAYIPFHGEIHFNDNENFATENVGDNPVSMFWVALHEIGHALGIKHSTIQEAVMQPYSTDKAFSQTELDQDDLAALGEQYIQDYTKYELRNRNAVEPQLLLTTLSASEIEELGIDAEPRNDYQGRSPLPAECLNRIETAFYYYDRNGITENDRLYILSYGYTWVYERVEDASWPWSMVPGFPKRTDKVFDVGGTSQFDAAFDNGQNVYLVAHKTVYSTTLISSTGVFNLIDEYEMKYFDGLDMPVRDAFMSVKTECVDKADTTCRETTFIVDDDRSYKIKWKKMGKVVLKNSLREVNTPDITGEDMGPGHNNCKFEAVTEIGTFPNRLLCFRDRFMYKRYFYPAELGYGDRGSQRPGVSETPENFQISGWCVMPPNDSD